MSLKQAAYCLPAGGGGTQASRRRRRRQAIRQARTARFELMTFLLRTTKDQISYKNGAVIISDELWFGLALFTVCDAMFAGGGHPNAGQQRRGGGGGMYHSSII